MVDDALDTFVISPVPEPGPRPPTDAVRLAAAILQRAVQDACGDVEAMAARQGLGERAEIEAGALAWVMTEDGGPFGFQACCGLLGLDPEAVRAAVADFRRRGERPVFDRSLNRGYRKHRARLRRRASRDSTA